MRKKRRSIREENFEISEEEPKDRRKVWKEELIIKIYEYAKAGYHKVEIAQLLGITYATFMSWREKYPTVRYALKKGYAWKKENKTGTQTWEDFVIGRLPDKEKDLWNKINQLGKDKIGGVAKIEMLLDRAGKQARQYLFIHALMKCKFSLTKACQKVNISKATFNKWKETDPDFVSLVDMIQEAKKDFFESALIRLVESGDSPATIMANKTLNKDRGYGERSEHAPSVGTVNYTVINVDELNLPLETRRNILDSLRKKVNSKEISSAAIPALNPANIEKVTVKE